MTKLLINKLIIQFSMYTKVNIANVLHIRQLRYSKLKFVTLLNTQFNIPTNIKYLRFLSNTV